MAHTRATVLLIASAILVGIAVNLFVLPEWQFAGVLFTLPVLVTAQRSRLSVMVATLCGMIALCALTGLLGSKDPSTWPVNFASLLLIGTLAVLLGAQRIERLRLLEHERQIRHEIECERQRLDSILGQIPVWIWEVDTRGRYTYSNPSIQTLLGYAPSDVLGLHLLELIKPEDGPDIASTLNEALRRRTPFRNVVVRMCRRDGRDVWLELSAIPLFDVDGQCAGLRGAGRDVTERHERHEGLLRAERLSVVKQIAQHLSGAMTDPLGILLAYPDRIRSQLPDDHPVQPFCRAVLDAAFELSAINRRLSALGEPDDRCDEPVNLNSVAWRAISAMMPVPPTLHLDVRLAADLLPIVGSPIQLQEMISNLLTNAREAMYDRGTVSIVTENVYVDEPLGHLGRIAVGEYVRLEVSDTGVGISPAIRRRIFDPFFSTRPGQPSHLRGLGLTLVHSIVDTHGGEIDMTSEPGQGSTFRVYLPVNREILREDHGEGIAGGSESILVVDDDADQRDFTTRTLRALGYMVRAVSSGEEAVAYLTRHHVDLVILDLVMPPGIDGVETYQRILTVRPGQRAIFVSGESTSERAQEAQRLGAGAFLRKPVTLGVLARVVRRELDRSGDPALVTGVP
jgi:two-component system cell cycle sensor histidine kinase/response regulator CckA